MLVLAGIHQYGTWIAAEYFRKLAAGSDLGEGNELRSDRDFCAIVYGEFNPKSFRVTLCDIERHYLWFFDAQAGSWLRVTDG